jgi:nitroreductase
MELLKAIYERRAVRDYLSTPIDESTIRRLIDAAVQAPSAVNQQPWLFTVVLDQHKLDELSVASKTFMLETQPNLRASGHFHMLNDPDFQIFYHAPVLILISAESSAAWHTEDCALAAENLMLAACEQGLGSCWIGFAQGYLNTTAGKKLLGLPSASVAVAPIILGKPKSPPPQVPRKSPRIEWVRGTRVLSSA